MAKELCIERKIVRSAMNAYLGFDSRSEFEAEIE